MMILQKSRGINNYLEVSKTEIPDGYEGNMLVSNIFKYIPPTEIRVIDGCKTMYVKIDGMCTLVARYARFMPTKKDVKKLLRDISGCLKEMEEYLLDPGGLLIDARYILYNSNLDSYCFLYVPGRRESYKEQLKLLLEEIMKSYDHSDREGVMFLYDFYSGLLSDRFDPELFLSASQESGSAQNSDYGGSFHKNNYQNKPSQEMAEKSRASGIFFNNVESELTPDKKIINKNGVTGHNSKSEKHKSDSGLRNRGQKDKESKDNPDAIDRGYDWKLYIVTAVAALVVSVILIMMFGVSAIKFDILIITAALVYIVVNVLHIKEEIEMDSSMVMDTEVEELRPEIEDEAYKYDEEASYTLPESKVYEASAATDTTVLAASGIAQPVSRLIPRDTKKGEQILLIEGETRVGRQPQSCDYCLTDPSISRLHAILEKENGHFQILDPGSKNGTYLNDERIPVNQPVEAYYGDKISFAGLEYDAF